MGTASFGGGSGSIGGGGSGAKGSGGSLTNAITHLLGISSRLKLDGDQGRLTKEINTLLQDRGRASSIKTLLGDGFADALLGDLLDVKARLDSDESWAVIVDAYGVTAGIRSMEAFCDNRIDAALGTSHYDDRTVERAAIILSDVSRSIYTKVFGPPLPHTMQYTIPMNFFMCGWYSRIRT